MNIRHQPASGVSVQVRGLRKSFDGQEVLKGIDFEVQPGEIFVIMGPSGSGKSVLLKHLIGLEPPDAGEILINGESIQSPEIASKYRHGDGVPIRRPAQFADRRAKTSGFT